MRDPKDAAEIAAPAQTVRLAASSDAAAIAEVLREGAAKMAASSGSGWADDEISLERIADWIVAGEAVVAQRGGDIIGFMLLQWSDPIFWPEHHDAKAGYLHKLAVRRRAAGADVPAALVSWAVQQAKKVGRTALRLDCGPWPSLCALYERLGFVELDRVSVENRICARFERKI